VGASCILTAGFSVLYCAAAVAADQVHETKPPEQQQEIIVTGERAKRPLKDTPSSVVVLTARDLNVQPDADRLDKLLEQIPNVQLGNGGQGPTIRGQDSSGVLQDLPAFLGGTRPRVTLQVDGRAVSYGEFVSGVAPLWDVARVEVFRSPQSTTQGRNSIAGAIFVQTNDPTYDWEARARLIHANFDAWQGSAVVSGPIVDGQLAFRLSGDARTSRPAVRVVNTLVAGANPNRDRYGTVRAKLLAEPRALPGFRLEATYVHLESRQPPFEGAIRPFRDRGGSPFNAVFDNNVDSLTTEARYDIADELRLTTTLSAGWVVGQRFAVPGFGETVTHIRDRSIETLLDWRPSDRLKARVGLHHLRTRLNQSIDLSSASLGLGEFADRQRSLGFFGEVELKLLPRITATAGLRYQRDGQDRDGMLGNPFFPTILDFDRTFTAWLPKLVLAYDFSDRVRAGLMIQRAYNPGGPAINFDTGRQEEFAKESLWSYELFGRATLVKDRLWLTANLFRNDFHDAQRAEQRAFPVAPGRNVYWALIYNVPKARTEGVEASVDWRLTDRLRARGGLGLLRARIDDDAPAPFAGNRFGRAPKFSANASIEWQPINRLQINADVRHHGGYFSDDLNTPALRIGKATVVDARAAYDLGRVTVSVYGRNLFDNFYLTSLFNPDLATSGDPREIGVELEARF
jgi:outer membrane receptor protein involved in Fe transport